MVQTRGFQYSALLHGLILVLLVFGLPSFLHRHIDPEPMAISVDILPIAPISNVKPQERTPEPEQKKPQEQQHTEKRPTPETSKSESTPEEQPEKISAKQVVKPVKPKPEKKPQKTKSEDLDSILKSVKETAKAEQSNKPTKDSPKNPAKTAAKSDRYDNSLPLSLSEKDGIRQQIEQFWEMPAGAKDAYNLIVTLHLTVAPDGTVNNVELAHDQDRYNSDSFFRAAVDSAMRAVRRASPLKNLPQDKLGTWSDMELTFDPHDKLY